MSNNDNETTNDNSQLSAAVRALVLAFFAIVLAVVSVSFAIHHMREGFEKEYRNHYQYQLEAIAMNATLIINGNELAADPIGSGQKYPAIINLMLPAQSDDSFSTIDYGLFSCLDEKSLSVIYMSRQDQLVFQKTPMYKWKNNQPKPYATESDDKNSILVPILDGEGTVVGLFELTGTHTKLREYGDALEGQLLMAVIIAAVVGLVLFSIQYFIPKLLLLRKREEEG
ncbi:MAG: hypothetical protein PHF65_00330 [Oscillospiraceae bacterium]|nr:hypothetical protein [Oscillospiraceae bacterium]